MADETFQIEIVYPNGAAVPAELVQIEDDGTQTEERCPLRLHFEDREISSCEETFWHSLCALWAELEKEGILLRCYGASRNVHPFGMCLNMGNGSVAYRTRIGYPALNADLVNIFRTGPDVDPASVVEQEDFHQQWLDGFKTMR